jgi:hypothetical protein
MARRLGGWIGLASGLWLYGCSYPLLPDAATGAPETQVSEPAESADLDAVTGSVPVALGATSNLRSTTFGRTDAEGVPDGPPSVLVTLPTNADFSVSGQISGAPIVTPPPVSLPPAFPGGFAPGAGAGGGFGSGL